MSQALNKKLTVDSVPDRIEMLVYEGGWGGLAWLLTSIVVKESVLARDADVGRSVPDPGRCLEAESGRESFICSTTRSS